jgi:carbonic anhydrase
VSATDDLLANSKAYTASFPGPLPTPPARRVAVVCCMDARIDVFRLLGLAEGDAHVLRNAGGVITDDVLRSLAISQRHLGTREIILIAHTQCGLIDFRDEEFKDEIRAETGVEPPWAPQSLSDLDEDLRTAIAGLQDNPVLPATDAVRGFVYDVATGVLREVGPAGPVA